MQTWQIKAFELEGSLLKSLDGFVHEHALYFLIGIIHLLVALLAWVISGGLRRKGGTPSCQIRPVIVIHSTETPPPQEIFDPIPPLRECNCDHDDDDWAD